MFRTRSSKSCFQVVVFALVLLMGFTSYSQTPKPTPSPKPVAEPSLESHFFRNILEDQKAIWTAPLHLHRKDAKWMVPFGVGSMALITTDRITGDEIGEFDRPVKTSRIISYGGSSYGVGAVAATFYVIGRNTNNARARETGVLGAEAMVDSAIVVSALKAVTQRARPLAGRERSEFFERGNSFPSGHSIEAWSLATIVADEYEDRPLVKWAAYGAASAVSVARFTAHKHYLSDVLVGSALGYGIGQYVYHSHHRRISVSDDTEENNAQSSWPAISAHWDRGTRTYGVALSWKF